MGTNFIKFYIYTIYIFPFLNSLNSLTSQLFGEILGKLESTNSVASI